METIIKNTARTRLMLAKAFLRADNREACIAQLELLRSEIRAYKTETTILLRVA
jgi:hypothetical protein